MTDMTTVERLQALINDKFGVAIEAIDPDAPFSSYDLDSLTVAELMFAIEDEMHALIPEDALRGITTVRGLAAVIDQLPMARRAA